MEHTQIMCDVAEGILTITLNRPEKLNVFTPVMFNELVDALNKADADDNVRVIIITGAGRAFCAGSDLSPDEEVSKQEFQVLSGLKLWK